MLQLQVGSNIEVLPVRSGSLYIGERLYEIPRSRIFNPEEDRFDILADLDYRKACDIVDGFIALFPGGSNTLTKEGVPDVLLEALLNKPKSLKELLPENSKDPSYISAQRMVRRVFRSPVLSKMLSPERRKQEFSFNRRTVIFAKIDRVELGDFDARAVAFFLMAHYKGQIVVEDAFYLRDTHISLIRERRLVAGVKTLSQVKRRAPDLFDEILLIEDKEAHGTTFEDAKTLADYMCRFPPQTDGYDTFIKAAMA